MRLPQLYINVGQTIGMATVATVVFSYIFDYRGFRRDINDLVSAGRVTYR